MENTAKSKSKSNWKFVALVLALGLLTSCFGSCIELVACKIDLLTATEVEPLLAEPLVDGHPLEHLLRLAGMSE
jgi:hypothetical protein